MANPPTPLWIPRNDAVLGVPAPTVDGFTDLRGTAVVSPTEAEDMGYGSGPRIELSSGTFEDVIFSAIHGGGPSSGFIYLAWTVNSGQRFDAADRIVVALRPSAATHSQAAARRIDIKPFGGPDGADGPGGTDLGGGYAIRTGYPAQEVDVYAGEGAATWGSRVAPPAGLEARVRSWILPRPPAPFVHEHGWSVELKVPIASPSGGGWIDLEPHFGLYWNVIRSYEPGGGRPAVLVQDPWPRDDGVQRLLAGTFGTRLSIPGDHYGEAILPALGGAPARPQGVKVRRNAAGVPLAGVKRDDELTAVLYNDKLEDDAPGVLAEFRTADWGIPGVPPAGWEPILTAADGSDPAAAGNGVTVPHGNGVAGSGPNVETTPLRWVDADATAANPRPCVWIRLFADGTPVNFVEPGLRVNMDPVLLSEHVRDAVISGKGWHRLPRGRSYEFLLAVYARRANVSRVEFGELEVHGFHGDFELFRFWNWFVKAFRNTYRSLEVDRVKYPVYEIAGSFGHLIGHAGLSDGLGFEMAGLQELEPGRWHAKVPTGRQLDFRYRLWSDPDKPDEWGEKRKEAAENELIRDPRFPDPAELGRGDEPFARPPWDPRPYPDSHER